MITFLIHTLPLCLRRMTPEGNGAALPVYRILPLLLLIPPGRVSMPASRVCPVYFHAPYSVYTLLRPESTPPAPFAFESSNTHIPALPNNMINVRIHT